MTEAQIIHFQPRPKAAPPAPTPAQRAVQLAAEARAIADRCDDREAAAELRQHAHRLDALAHNLSTKPTGPSGGGVA